MTARHFDVIIVGAGPAGCAAAIVLGNHGRRVAIVEKEVFPRDKICGDALSVDVVNQLERLSPLLATQFQQLAARTASYGVRIYSPDHQWVDIPFIHKNQPKCGFICQRMVFDHLLFLHLSGYENISIFTSQQVNGIEITGDNLVQVSTKDLSLTAPLVIGADGAQSIVAKTLAGIKVDKKHYSAGIRAYYDKVAGFNEGNYIELLFFKNILPGYLWIFPLPGGKANVGIGMLSSTIAKKKVNLRKTLNSLLSTHPLLRERFAEAIPLEGMQGFGLPLGSKKRPLSGDHYLLTGDAGGLIDPFSGEGIANAIRSGRIAADHAHESLSKNDYSAKFNKAYDHLLYSKIWNELKISHALQKMCKYPRLFNFIVGKANKNPSMQQFLIDALANASVKKLLLRPSFYFRLLVRKQ